jgi:glycyl-tRNA synthetase beta chain
MMSDLLFELGTEELPSGAVPLLAESLAEALVTRLEKAGITHGVVQSYATPRRIGLRIRAAALLQSSQTISRKGPAFEQGQDKLGQPTPALIGFAKSCGVTIEALSIKDTEKGPWWYYESVVAGRPTRELLPALLADSLAALPIAKPMRWGTGEFEFVRPVHWAVLLLGEEVIPCTFFGIKTSQQSRGHRFHHPDTIDITSPATYESQLNDVKVIADFNERRARIVEQINALAQQKGFNPVVPEALLNEVTAIVEWPVALMVSFNPEFLLVPAEALIASMQSHQKCFALRNADGALVPYFITVSNIQSQTPERVVAGNEKVMRARLSDAAFFYQQDRKKPLIDYRPDTSRVVFQAGLGTLLDKSERIGLLLQHWVQPMGISNEDAARAALLSRCDLMTGMVGEFPELQGLMGYYYAHHDGETAAVACALNEQYMPRFSTDHLPQSSLGRSLSLADRLDSLVGGFAIGQKPTGVKDPFKLRRHALAVVRMLIELPNAPALSTLINQAVMVYGSVIQAQPEAMEELRVFILERLFAYYESQSISADIVKAVRACQEEHLFDADKRMKALQIFVNKTEAASLSAACKRVDHLLHQAEDPLLQGVIDVDLFQEPAERELYQHVLTVEQTVSQFSKAHDYEQSLIVLASLREPVDEFFDKVMVMSEDKALRRNRLQVLARLQQCLQGVANIALLEP